VRRAAGEATVDVRAGKDTVARVGRAEREGIEGITLFLVVVVVLMVVVGKDVFAQKGADIRTSESGSAAELCAVVYLCQP
jgi:hypothetical protein